MFIARFIVFLISIFGSLLTLILERLTGIEWDFHPDSYTYATTSIDVYNNVVDSGDWYSVFNNGYYLLCAFFNESVIVITVMNMIFYALANVIICDVHNRHARDKSLFLLALLIFNPYRLHLSTTLLKDSFVILLLLLSFFAVRGRYISFLLLLIVRLASSLYLIVLLEKKYLKIILIVVFLGLLVSEELMTKVLTFNESEMNFRDFNRVPSFQDMGLFGVLIRAVVWPLITLSGLFFIMSPSLMFFPLAIGSIFQIIYIKKQSGSIKVPASALMVLSVFAVMVTGYTSYIRYVFPILTIIPVLIIKMGQQER